MPSFFIPPKETKRWTGPYLGNYYGTLWKTFNVDLDKNEGTIGLSRRFERIEDTVAPDFTGDNAYVAFLRTNSDCTDRYWALRDGGGLSKTDSATPENATLPSDSWDTDALASTPVACRDFTVHGNDSRNDSGRNKLFVTLDSGDIAVLNDTGNSAWTASWWQTKQSQAALFSATLARPIEYFPFRRITLVGSGNILHTISRPTDTQNDTFTNARLVLPKDLNIEHIFTTSNRAWLLCMHRFGGEGVIIEWDGYSESYNDIHRAYGYPLSGVDFRGVPIVINDNGDFLEFTGRGFQPMIRSGQSVAFPVAEKEGLTLSSGSDTARTRSIAPRGMVMGEDGLIYVNVGQPAGVTSDRHTAGVWCLNPITGRLYNKYSLGRWGDSVDYGHQSLNAVGSLYWIPTSVSARNLLAGGRIQITAAGGEQTGLWLLEAETSTTTTRGHFITQFIQADEIRNFWDSLWLRFRRFLSSGNRLIVKARGVRSLYLANRRPLSATITWTTTTTFTLTLVAADDSLTIGDEVEVLNGVNAGYLAHITVISGAHAALQTITIDETVTTGSSTSLARFERWKKLGTISSTTVYEHSLPIGITSSFVQFKVELRGPASEMELNDIIVNYEVDTPLKK